MVADVKEDALNDQIAPEIYVPHLQNPAPLMNLLVRTTSDPLRLAPRIRAQVMEVDRDQPVYNISTMENVFGQSLAEPKVITSLLATFAALALILATLGVYSVLSYSVAQRTHEIGIRMAIGAQQQHVLRIIVGQALRLVLVGSAIGVTMAFALTRIISSWLFGVTATDPAVFFLVPGLLVVVALVASYLPARKALQVDPATVLRQ
jgi:putative ABC transport system permease protein